jgi:hypothetical protein
LGRYLDEVGPARRGSFAKERSICVGDGKDLLYLRPRRERVEYRGSALQQERFLLGSVGSAKQPPCGLDARVSGAG